MSKIKVGVFGVGRGLDLAKNFMLLDAEIVAVCDFIDERMQWARDLFGNSVAYYEDFDEFIKHDMDAVILANYFHEHAPYAIKCFEKGIHVFSECISNGTMAEGVELIRAFEKSSSIYFLAENYPQMKFNREMQRIVDGGTLGEIVYAEGEYNHPGDPMDVAFKKRHNYFPEHWRNHLPKTYYVTHSLGPIMRATGATPKKVSAFSIYMPSKNPQSIPSADYNSDFSAVMLTQNDDGSVFRFTGCAAFGAHGNSYRLCGKNGQVENLRGMGEKVMLRYNSWTLPEGASEISLYEPGWHDKDEKFIETSGHGGADYITARIFVECVKEGKQPPHPFDIHSAVAMSSVAILGHRSVLNGGTSYDIPDFRTEEARKLYENDRDTPFYGTDGSKPTIPCGMDPDYGPTEEQMRLYKELVMDK